jgi:hypothetical protein
MMAAFSSVSSILIRISLIIFLKSGRVSRNSRQVLSSEVGPLFLVAINRPDFEVAYRERIMASRYLQCGRSHECSEFRHPLCGLSWRLPFRWNFTVDSALARNSANQADCHDDFLCSGRERLLRSFRSQAMAVTRFFKGIDCGSDDVVEFPVSVVSK